VRPPRIEYRYPLIKSQISSPCREMSSPRDQVSSPFTQVPTPLLVVHHLSSTVCQPCSPNEYPGKSPSILNPPTFQKTCRSAAPHSLTGYFLPPSQSYTRVTSPFPTSIFLQNRASPSSKVSTPLRASTVPVQSSSPPSDMVRPLPRKQHPVFKTTPSPNSRHRPRPSPISRPPATYLPLDRSRPPPKRPYIPPLRSASSIRA
jgi:hypothetical protein